MFLVLKKNHLGLVFVLVLVFLSPSKSGAMESLTINIDEGTIRALSLGIVPIKETISTNVFDIVADNLKLSGRFDIFNQADILSNPTKFEDVNFKSWRIFGVENILVGDIKSDNDGYKLVVELIDILRQTRIFRQEYRLRENRERAIAHNLSNAIYKQLIGKVGCYNTKIAYVAVSIVDSSRFYSIIISDYDGYNSKEILNSRQPILSLAWSRTANKIAYVSFESGRSLVYVQDFKTGERKKIVYGDGIMGAPEFSLDDNSIIFTASISGNIDLYKYNLIENKFTRLTKSEAIETEASLSPDGNKIIFTSNRSGGTQIFRMDNKPFSIPKRVTFGLSRFNANPVYSPSGDKFSFVTNVKGSYQVVVSDLEQQQQRLISNGKFDESPSFASNGDMIVFSSKKGTRSELIIKSTEGLDAETRIFLPNSSLIEPSWGPAVE